MLSLSLSATDTDAVEGLHLTVVYSAKAEQSRAHEL